MKNNIISFEEFMSRVNDFADQNEMENIEKFWETVNDYDDEWEISEFVVMIAPEIEFVSYQHADFGDVQLRYYSKAIQKRIVLAEDYTFSRVNTWEDFYKTIVDFE
jgi:hypothetical protein